MNNRSKEMEEMAYIASHDLQQPLNTISTMLQLIERKYAADFDEKGNTYLKYALGSSNSMRDLIRSLLDYSRLGKEETLEFVDCNIMLQEVKVDLSTLIEQKNAIIQIDNLPNHLSANTAKLKLLFQNIINNAIKFQVEGSKPIVIVSAKDKDLFWEFSIKDNGIGIEEKHFEKIFQIFQRLQTKEAFEGTGIGLAHCKKIVELHRGKIWLESTPNVGTTFYFTIKKNLETKLDLDILN